MAAEFPDRDIALDLRNATRRARPLRQLAGLGAVTAFALASAATHAQDLVVSAAASLTDAFKAVGAAYEQTYPGRRVTFNFAASGPLLAQIRQGAPVDVFASADQETMDRAAAGGLLAEGTRADFARNTLVVVVPAGPPNRIPAALGDLAGPAFRRIAAGSPSTVPAGRYAMAALQKAGLAQAVEPRMIYGESVRQVLNYVARGEVDAGFVYRTDALVEHGKTRIAFEVPTPMPIAYPIAQVASGRNAASGKDFVSFVRGPQGRRILERHGFAAP